MNDATHCVQRVTLLVDEYVTPRGGTERQLLQLIRFLDRSRYEPAIALLRDSEYVRHHGLPCEVQVLGITKLCRPQAMAKIVRFGIELRRRGCRLVHCFFNDSSMIGPPLLRLLGIRVIVSRRDMGFWYTRGKLAALRFVAPFVTRYVANSHAVARIVQRAEGVRADRVSVIHNGYVAPEREDAITTPQPCEMPDGAPIVGIVANVAPIKRIDILIQAFALVAAGHACVRLIVVGDHAMAEGPGRLKALQALTRTLGVEGRVVFTGAVDDPMRYVERFTVAVLCSESEGFSNAIIEYMQAARPIVCTDTGGNPELIEDNRNGFLVPVGDVAMLAERIALLLRDAALAKRLGDAACASVRSTYSATRMASEQMACYDDVLSA